MYNKLSACSAIVSLMLATVAFGQTASRHDKRIALDASMLTNELGIGSPERMVDEQKQTTSPAPAPTGAPTTAWETPGSAWSQDKSVSAYFDLGEQRYLSNLWIYDTNGVGTVLIEAGAPGNWHEVASYRTTSYMKWSPIVVAEQTRYLRLTRLDGAANFTEIALFETTPQEFAELKKTKDAEDKVKAEKAAAAKKLADERAAGEKLAKEATASQKMVDIGAPFGHVILVDEIDVAAADPGHGFAQSPANVSRIEQILDRPARVLNKTPGEAAYMTFRIGQYKGLKAGAAYVLEVEYPEDAPRSMIVLNAGNETSMGFSTGAALGDAFHPKYVNNLNESLNLPLSGKYEKWQLLFNLHDHFVPLAFLRGNSGNRSLTPLDGFPVTIAQWSADNLPVSHGAAVAKIRLYEVPDPKAIDAKYTLPPQDLPRRHIFWREEMADGVIDKGANGPAGLDNPLDWYKFKANQMSFLGMNTYTKDLLEFGHVQHWDPSAYGGNDWAYFNGDTKDLWRQIVTLMGERGFDILPYYEYGGSRGKNGLGNQRRAKPLTRDDAYTHIKWSESGNADITDPDTYEDFKKMLDITVIWQRDKAKFVGAWLRPRISSIPMGFGDSTRARFAEEANNGTQVTREQLKADKNLLARYEQWWMQKRRQFLEAMRDHLREGGVDDAVVLYTTVPGEPGVDLLNTPSALVTDDPDGWAKRLAASTNEADQKVHVVSVKQVLDSNLYLKSVLAKVGTWGGWEWQNAAPSADPQDYKSTDGVMLTLPFNRSYTTNSAQALQAFRAPAGLAIVRHYTLNENMMYDKDNKDKLGYFVGDVDRAGPYSMMAEALAVANGDPDYIGYLRALNFGRGFPLYARNFNTAFVSLPALPSEVVADAASDAQVVVRAIKTDKHGTYFAVVNTSVNPVSGVKIKLPAGGKVMDAASGTAIDAAGGSITLDLYPFQLRALHVQ